MTIVNDKELGVQELFFKNVDDKESGAEQVDLPESSLNQETGNKGNKNAKQSELSLKTLGELVGRRVKKLEIAIKYEYTVSNVLCRLTHFNISLSSHVYC